MILYGAPVREEIKRELIERIKKLGRRPVLAVVQVGDREDSNVYVRNKKRFGEEVGIEVKIIKIEHDTNTRMNANDTNKKEEEKLEEEIRELNNDEGVDGIIVQLPLPACAGRPEGFDTEKIINLIKPEKDADGLVNLKIERLKDGKIEKEENKKIVPATARGVLALLDFYKIEIKNKKVAVIGQGRLAGKPIADELEKRGAEVARCDINTKNIPEIARNCDILISATGKKNLITKEFVNERQVVIDVGNDVDFAEVEPIVHAVTPVPGGVGPLTVACLFENLLDLCYSDAN